MCCYPTKIGEPEQALVAPDGFYTLRPKGAVSMSGHDTSLPLFEQPQLLEASPAGCVYVATNLINRKQYVGKTRKTLDRRKWEHRRDAAGGITRAFQRALRKYGFDAFSWETVFEHEDEAELNKAEVAFIAALGSKVPHGYNMTDGGEGRSGYKLSESTRKKISLAKMGNKIWLGRTCSPEHRKKIGLANLGKNKGKKHTEEAKRKIGEASKGNKTRFRSGHVLSEETRKKMSKSHKGKVFSEEHKANLRKNHTRPMKGRTHSEETRRKMSEAHKGNKNSLGHKASEETRKKMSEGIKRTWERRKQQHTQEKKPADEGEVACV